MVNSVKMLPPGEESDSTIVVKKLTAPLRLLVEPVGRWYEAHKYRRHHHHTLSTLSHNESLPSSDSSEEDDLSEDEDDSMLLTLDPKEWKDHDHYEVLGIKKLRYKASEEQIKKAYKRKVLKHHPDKREKAGGVAVPRKDGDDDYFTCITKAYEILGNAVKRRSYDSVDPEFDDEVPSLSNNSKEKFFEVFTPAFERNARWSNKRRVPKLGTAASPIEEVDRFYKFWYDFNSWREFSYLDEEEKEKGENRDERRWIEKQNKVEQKRRKKEEVTRLRQLVDNAYACDPRIKKFRDDEREKKAAEKRAKQEAIRAAVMEKERERQAVLEAERLAKEKEEEEAKAKALAAKKEREAIKKVLKKERRKLRDTAKKYDYFTSDEPERVKLMTEVEKLCEALSVTSLQSLNEELGKDEEAAKSAFFKQVSEMNEAIENEKREEIRKLQATQGSAKGGKGGSKEKQWSNDDLQILIKAANIFPPGTVKRYDVIANYINQHSTSGISRNAKDIISKTKDLQKLDPTMKAEVNKRAFDKFEQTRGKLKKDDIAAPSQRFNNGASEAGSKEAGSNDPKSWTSDEQKRLEQALKTYPPSTKERWDRIAEAVPTRTKKECMLRYKELVEMVKAKKAAQAGITKPAKS